MTLLLLLLLNDLRFGQTLPSDLNQKFAAVLLRGSKATVKGVSAFDGLIDLQNSDTELAQLSHRAAHLPEQLKLNECDAALIALRDRLAPTLRDREALTERQEAFEHQLFEVDAKIASAEKQLYSGSVTASRELQALEADIASLKKHRSDVEDHELEVLVACEPLDTKLAEGDRQRAVIDEQAKKLHTAKAEAMVAIEQETQRVTTQRTNQRASIEAGLLARFDAVANANRGVGAARLEHGTCMGCRIKLPSVEIDRIRHLAAETVYTCEECGVILVRNF